MIRIQVRIRATVDNWLIVYVFKIRRIIIDELSAFGYNYSWLKLPEICALDDFLSFPAWRSNWEHWTERISLCRFG